MRVIGNTIYIPGIDAKDLYISNLNDKEYGYSLINKNGEANYRKYVNALDYSLDQIKLREVYEKVYRRTDFSFFNRKKEFTSRVINVTFKYAVAEFNRAGRNKYIKLGYKESDLTFEDCVAVQDGELLGIILDSPVTSPLDNEILGSYFKVVDGVYKLKRTPKTVKGTAELRQELYQDGFICGGIKYVRWKRSSGSSRVGKCLFIDEKLYKRMHKWEMCGLKIKEGDEVDLAALESYISLPTSSIVDILDIDPDSILVIDDFESSFTDHVVSVSDCDGKLVAKEEDCTITNSIWDGQGLIDISAMGAYKKKGMILLRNLFFKCCCFNCNLQQWFEDNGITDISQLNGYTRAKNISDIKIVTTPSSIKYLKFGSIDKWLDNIDSVFGVVKYDKPTHFFSGDMVQTHYQLLNTLQMTKEETAAFLKDTFDYMTLLRDNPAVLRYHIKYPIANELSITPAESKNDVVYKLLGLNEKFAQTKLYNDFKNDLLKSFTKNLRLGHVLVDGNYETLLGNPIEMLQASIGKFNGESVLGVGNIHTRRFPYGIELVGSRSPHISMSNVWVPVNVESKQIDKYFNLTKEIVCINSINENVLNRLSGADFDSDTVLLTDNPHILNAAKKNKDKYPVAISNVSSVKRKRKYTCDEQADLDIKTSNNLIGDIINLSQELNTRIWDKVNRGGSYEDIKEIYLDVCILNVASNLEIDSAKKEFNINNSKELMRLREKYRIDDDDGRCIKPNFFKAKDIGKGYYDNKKRNYKKHLTTMDFLQECVNSYRSQRKGKAAHNTYLPFSELIDDSDVVKRSRSVKVERVLNIINDMSNEIKSIYASDIEPATKAILGNDARQCCVEYVGSMSFSKSDMVYLLKQIEQPQYSKIHKKILEILFGYPNTSFYEVLKQNQTPVGHLAPISDGDVFIYGSRFCVFSTPIWS